MRPSAAQETAPAGRSRFAEDVAYYLSQTPRQLPSEHLYGELGSALFEAICRLPWYEITRVEQRLLERRARDIFSHVDPLSTLVELTGKAEGFGKIIGMGSKRMCEKYGHPELSMSVKGQEFPAYDARGIQGMGLGYATANRGACHLRSYTVASEILGIPEKTDPLVTEGKAGLVKAFQDATAVVDSSGLCLFTTFAWSMDDIGPQIDAACEGDWSVDNLMELGERIWNLERQFNMQAGFTGADDTLPKRLLTEAAKTGPAEGKVAGLGEMLPEYYELRGWTADGVPTDATLERLAL